MIDIQCFNRKQKLKLHLEQPYWQDQHIGRDCYSNCRQLLENVIKTKICGMKLEGVAVPVCSRGSSCRTGRRKSSPSQGKGAPGSPVRQDATHFCRQRYQIIKTSINPIALFNMSYCIYVTVSGFVLEGILTIPINTKVWTKNLNREM